MDRFLFVFLAILQDTVYFGAKEIYYYKETEKIILIDSAYVRAGEVHLFSDTIIYWKSQKKLEGWGRVVLIVKNDTIYGDSVFYNVETKRGKMSFGKSHIEKGWLSSRKIFRISDKEINAYNAEFTTCDKNPPHYTFYSPKLKAIKDNMAIAKSVVLKIQGIPILWAPFWYIPLTKKRKSGFLSPKIGFSSSDGKYIRRLAYYWAMSNYYDATFSLDIVEKRGPRFAIEFIYKKYKKFSGNINYTYAFDYQNLNRRWSLFGNHFHKILKNGILRAQSNYISDVNYIQDYSENKTEWLKRDVHSFLSYSHNFKFGNFLINFDDYRNFTQNIHRTFLPEIRFYLRNLKIGPFLVSSNFYGLNYKQDTLKRWAFKNNTSCNISFSIFKYLKMSHSISLTGTLFDKDSFGNKNVFYSVPAYSTSLNTTIYGYSLFGIWKFKRFRQIITPSVSYKFVPEIKKEGISPFDGFGKIWKSQTIRFSISNNYEGKWLTQKGEEKIIGILNSNFSISYDVFNKEFSPLNINLSFLPYGKVTTRYSTEYNLKNKKFGTHSLTTD